MENLSQLEKDFVPRWSLGFSYEGKKKVSRKCAPTHSALSVKQFLVYKRITTLKQPPYLPPCDFFIFPKVKSVLKEIHSELVDVVQKKPTIVLKQLTETHLLHVFDHWKTNLHWYTSENGNNIAVDNH